MPQAAGRPNVLLVEDDALVRSWTAVMLTELGYEVVEAEEGAEALALLQRHPAVRVLFTECRLPDLDGVALAKAAARLRPDLAIVLATGQPDAYATPWPILGKPYCRDDVQHVLDRQMIGAAA